MTLAALGYALEIEPPDIEPWRRGNIGIDYVTTLDSGRPGPHAWINALTHGNETCGAIAVDRLLRDAILPTRGRLTLSFANIAAYRNISEQWPAGTRYVDEDLNRVWGRLDEASQQNDSSYEWRRARALRPVADAADALLDLHAMTHPTEPLTIVGTRQAPAVVARGTELAQRIGYPRLLVSDPGHAAGIRLRDYSGFGRDDSDRTALVVECGGWWERRSADIAVATALRFLAALDMLDRDAVAPMPSPPPPWRLVEATDTIAVQSADFRFAQPFQGDEVIEKAGTLIATDGEHKIVTPYDDCFLMFPTADAKVGATAVRLGRIRNL